MKVCRLGLTLVAVLISVLLSSAAKADTIDITLTASSLSGQAGDAITFYATLTNTSATDTIFLNGDSSGTSSTFLTVDDTPFLTNAPFFLDPGDVSGPYALFNVLIDPTTPDGTYDLNSFSILGGLDGSSFDVVGTAEFSVTVGPAVAAPEPDMLPMLLVGLLSIGLLMRFRRFAGR